MKFCSLFMGCAIVVAGVVLTKEKLRHYLAFECAIREIAAVSDRHCLATDNPRTSVATIPLPLPSPDLRCSFSLSLAPVLPPSSLHFIIHNSRVPCTRRCTYTSPPIAFSLALCLMNAHSNILLSPRARGKMLSLARTGANHAFPNYSRLPPSSRHPFLLIIILRSS